MLRSSIYQGVSIATTTPAEATTNIPTPIELVRTQLSRDSKR